ncbi:MAG: MgtC/SapB family protein [Actinomycetota bacterium]|nr:MgtC/SapB family protein [Actinomycetota bacterium]
MTSTYHLSVIDLIVRVLIAAVLGALIGLDRELSNQSAGLRTHILVSLGALLFTMTGAYVFPQSPNIDPTRIAAQVVTGIGFLGAGAILRQGVSVRGLTTAAGLWVTAAVGIAVALGFWVGAVAVSVVTALSLFGLKRVERKMIQPLKPGRYLFTLETLTRLKLSDVTQKVEQERCRVDSARDFNEDEARQIELVLRLPPRVRPETVSNSLASIDGVVGVNWSR